MSPLWAWAAPDQSTATDVKHWAYVKPVRPRSPGVGWFANPVDAFVFAGLQKEGMHPSAEADRATLIRRVSLDLIGLPPTVKEVDEFVHDASRDAYEKVVDRLLASPHFGERQAIHWLDLARYADSNGYEKDRQRSMWPYRDWVIDAFNRDMPFDQFTIEQIAGDLLPNATLQQKIATGFHRNTMMNEEGGVDEDEYFFYTLVDRVNTTATVWLGTTLGCAQCHNHKYDPFSQKDYYSLMAYFNGTAAETAKEGGHDPHDVSVKVTVDVPQADALQKQLAALELQLNAPSDELAAAEVQWEAHQATAESAATSTSKPEPRSQRRTAAAPAAIPRNIAAILAIARDQRDEKQNQQLTAYYHSIAPQLQPLRAKIDEVKRKAAAIPKTSLVMLELPEPRPTHIHVRGAYLTLGDKVEPAVPAILGNGLPASTEEPSRRPTRLDLARWLVSDQNPLTARVTVNRIWEQYFGRGLVATSEDFGTQGEAPANPQLLDWLACEFQAPTLGAKPWSLKAMHRLIVTSAAYRQSSQVTAEEEEKDPYNKLLARGPRFRLPAELIRDQSLAASGLLSEKMGGPSVFPLQPDGIWHLPYSGDKWVTSEGTDRFRRSVYTFHRRSAPYPEFMAFDKTALETLCTRRSRTDTPLQALTTLNDPAFMQPAAALARRIVAEGGSALTDRVSFAFRCVLSRPPTTAELRRLEKLYSQMLATYEDDAEDAQKVAGSGLTPLPAQSSVPELAAWTMVSNVLFNLDETLTKQ